MSSFFTIPKSQKRKRSDAPSSATKKPRTSGTPGRGGRTTASRGGSSRGGRTAPTRQAPRDDESISGSESDLSAAGDEGYESAASDVSGESETAAEKKLRLAEAYLEKVKAEVAQEDHGFDAAEIDRENLAHRQITARLKDDVAEDKGKLYKWVAGAYAWDGDERNGMGLRERTCVEKKAGPVTACAMGMGVAGQETNSSQEIFVYTATKDMRILKWRIHAKTSTDANDTLEDEPKGKAKSDISRSQRRKLRAKRRKDVIGGKTRGPVLVASTRGNHSRKKDNTYDHHVGPILCLALSPLGDLLVSGGADKRMIVWDAATLTPKRVFTQHRAAVTSLAFCRNTKQMFSGSADRTIKVWSMEELAYVETLFGHQDEVQDVGALANDRCVSVGGRDRTARFWKVTEETQLVFRGGGSAAEKESKKDRKRGPNAGETELDRLDKRAKSAYGEGSIDRVAVVDDEIFITGSDNGNLCLWSTQKKKPAFTVPLAHGLDPQMTLEEAFADRELDDEKEVPGPPLPRAITALAVLPLSNLVITGSWDGVLRAWSISEDKKRLETVGTLGKAAEHVSPVEETPLTIDTNGLVNGVAKKLTFETDTNDVEEDASDPPQQLAKPVEGTVIEADGENDDTQLEEASLNGDASQVDREDHLRVQKANRYGLLDGVVNDLRIVERGLRGQETLFVTAAVSKEPRQGRWRTFQSKNGVSVFEVRKISKKMQGNGVQQENGRELQSD